MAAPLVHRFQFGTTTPSWPGRYTPAGMLFHEIAGHAPSRQGQVLRLLERQIAVQKAAADTLTRAQTRTSEALRTEIDRQTVSLQEQLNALTASLAESTHDLAASVEHLGATLSAGLDELRWLALEQKDRLDGILQALRENRSNEARQHVRQGVRHLLAAQFEKAAGHFEDALTWDSTDYEALMSLGFTRIHTGDADAALAAFSDALLLPHPLDDELRARALWARARLRYALEQYPAAADDARHATDLEGDRHPVGYLRRAGCEALAGMSQEALRSARRAVELDPHLFATVATEPDLDAIRPQLYQLLADMLERTREQVHGTLARLESDAGGLTVPFRNDISLALTRVRQRLETWRWTYAACRAAQGCEGSIQEALAHARAAEAVRREQPGLSEAAADARHRVDLARASSALATRRHSRRDTLRIVVTRPVLVWLMSGVFSVCLLGVFVHPSSAGDYVAGALLGPLIPFLTFIAARDQFAVVLAPYLVFYILFAGAWAGLASLERRAAVAVRAARGDLLNADARASALVAEVASRREAEIRHREAYAAALVKVP